MNYNKHPLRLNNPWLLACFFLLWVLAFTLIPNILNNVFDSAPFVLLGIMGAIFANATGAGGGVVFIPVFNQLGFTEAQAVATSFGIQSFGMTAGALAWFIHYRLYKTELHLWQSFLPIITCCVPFSVIGLWIVYLLNWHALGNLKISFGVFSLILGLVILGIALKKPRGHEHSQLLIIDYIGLGIISLLGGLITAWLSVGVGEMVAIYLILRRFDITMAVAVAVIITAFTVWFAAPQHMLISPQINWNVVMFAGPGAILGAIFARTLATRLSARKLKLFFAVWLLVLGSVELFKLLVIM